jgi:hypothetical protein
MSKKQFITLYATKIKERHLAFPDQFKPKSSINNGVMDDTYFALLAERSINNFQIWNISDNLKAAVQEASQLDKLPNNITVQKFLTTLE